LSVSHKEHFHEVVQITVEDALGVGGLVTGTQILDHLVWMKDVAADLRAPFDLLFLTFKLSLLLLALLEFDVIETGFEDTESILTVVQL
jgi:hypothetical protein